MEVRMPVFRIFSKEKFDQHKHDVAKTLVFILMIFLSAIYCSGSAGAKTGSACSPQFGSSEKLLTIEQMNDISGGSGTFYSLGMPYEEFMKTASMSGCWTEILQDGIPSGAGYDITLARSYADIESCLYDLAKYEQARLFKIGDSELGKNIYSIEVGSGRKIILITGGVHARETAGTSFIIKQLEKLLKDSAADAALAQLLERYKIIAIPCVNPDGWDHLCFHPTSMKKSNGRGVDLNRNMPSSNAGQLAEGNTPVRNLNDRPGDEFYPGPYLGSESETKAAISWFIKHIPDAVVYVDYHQSGNQVYGGKTHYEEKHRMNRSKDLAYDVIGFMRSSGGSKWSYKKEEPELCYGEGSFTDFAVELACGLIFSPEFGRLCMNSEKGPVPLLFYKDMNQNMDYYSPLNKDLAVITLEIGSSSSRCYTERSRSLQSKIYEKQNFDEFLIYLMERDKANSF